VSDEGRRWFEQAPPQPQLRPRKQAPVEQLWERCPGCRAVLYKELLERSLQVCSTCGHHLKLGAQARVDMFADPGSFVRHDADVIARDPLGFVDAQPYARRLIQARQATGAPDAYLAGRCTIDGLPVQLGTFDFRFMGGSMGSVVGELITRQIERGVEAREPVVIVSASGGARMQEGVLSLMQMAKTSAALRRLRDEARVPYISVLTHPTTGGVAASFAMLGDLIFAEPKALIGFAGPRVVEQTIGEALPEGFQTSEYLLEHGMVDAIVPRGELRAQVSRSLQLLTGGARL
jgi:acetyl-CoA carboxylase carboxyl transferase subunit beta